MGRVKRRMLAYLLAMAMVLSLCTGITARAEGGSRKLLVGRDQGWNQETNLPIAPTSLDKVGEEEHISVMADERLFFGFRNGDKLEAITKEERNDLTIKEVVNEQEVDAGDKVSISPFYTWDDAQQKDVETDYGFVSIRINEIGEYRVYYGNSYVTIITEMPQAAMYSSVDCSIDDIISSGDKDIYYPYDKESNYYLGFNVPGATALGINNDGVVCTIWNSKGEQVSVPVPFYVEDVEGAKWSFELPEGKSLDYTDFETEITYTYTIEEQGDKHDETRNARFHFRLSKDGFVIAGAERNENDEFEFCKNKDWFNKEQWGEMTNDQYISLGWSEDGEITPVADADKISITNADGSECAATIDNKGTKWDDSKHEEVEYDLPDGVYRISSLSPQDYSINYTKGEETYSLKFSGHLPRLGIYDKDIASEESLVGQLGDRLQYKPGETYYVIASDDMKNDDRYTDDDAVATVKNEDIFSSYDPQNWTFREDAWQFTIKDDTIGRYDNVVEFAFSTKDEPDVYGLNLEEKQEGWKIADADWGEEGPTPRTVIDDYSSEITAEILDEKFISIGNLYNDGEETKIMLPDNEDVEIRILDDKKDPVTDPSKCSISKEYDAMGSMEPTPNGVFRLNTNEVGIYYIEMKYESLVHEFKLNVRMPQLGLYTTDSVLDPNTLVSTRSYEGLIDGTKENELFLAHNWSEGEIFDIQCVDLHLDDGIKADKTHFSKEDLANNSLTKVTFPPTNKPLAIDVEVTRGSQEHTWTDEFHISVRPAAVGFVISYSENNTFNENADSYGKDWGVDVKNDSIVSLATLSEDTLTPIIDESKLALLTADGKECTDGSTISKVTDGGVYAIKINTPGDYRLVYDNDQTVDINADFSNVAFVTEEGATYNSKDGSASKVSDEPFNAKLTDDQGEQLFEKEFYIGSYAYPADFAGRNKREIIIKNIEVKKGDETIEPEKGFSYEISDDEHTAKLNANMDAIDIVGDTLHLKVTYDVRYYYYDGEQWVNGYNEYDRDNWFEIYLGEDKRTELTAAKLDGKFVGEGYDRDAHSFEYDGTKKTLLYQIDNEEYAKLVDYHYEDNEETEINEDADEYETFVSFTIKDEYKAQYKIKGNFSNETLWTIVTPKAVKEIIESVEKDITSKPENITSEDEEVAKAVAEAKEKYDKLNDAQKKLINEDDTSKLNKAATAIKNYSDAVDKISNLPDTVALSDEAAIKAARTAYDKLTDAQKEVADNKYDITEKLESSEKELAKKKAEKKAADDKAAADAAVAKISKLPNNAGVDDEAAVKAARAAYDALTPDQKKLVDASILKKLTNAEESVAKAKKAAEDEKNKPKYSNEWIDGKWYNADGTQDYPGTLQWKNNATGWWVEDTDGWYPTNSWQKIDGIWYFFKPDGYMASNEYYNGYWFNSDGSWAEQYFLSWKQNATGWWVEDISGWWPSSSWLKIDGYWYYFDASGYMVTSQYVDGWWISADGVCY